MANQYRLASGYTRTDLLHTILSPDELEKRMRQEKRVNGDLASGEVREKAPIYGISA